MRAASRSALLGAVAVFVCMLHVSGARSDELCDASPTGGAVASASVSPASVGSGACPDGMVEVEGDYCPWLDQICIKRPEKMSYRCSEYAHPASYGKCQTGTAHKHFCMDVYEWPNKKGEMPTVWKSWYDARDACQSVGKRLCTEDEWTLACEGPEHLPYPYGFKRDATACNIDKDHPSVDEEALKNPAKREAEIKRLWQGEPSGARDRCVSPFGVHDMTGNVDEWTINETGKPHNSALKGGYWSWVRGRCRAVTPGHEEGFKYYQIGFRCCSSLEGGKEMTAKADAKANANANANAKANAEAKADAKAEAKADAKPEPPPPTLKLAPTVTPAPTVARTAAPPPARTPAPPPPARTPPPTPAAPDAPRGSIVIPPSGDGHRIYVDGKMVAIAPQPVFVPCGKHVVKVGSQGREQELDVPCGGRVNAAYP